MPQDERTVIEHMIEWLRNATPYLSTLFLSCFGGLASYVQRIRVKHQKFNLKELSYDLVISSFAGLMTYFFCSSSGVEGAKAAMLIAVSGHMGTRAIAAFEIIRDRIFGITPERNQNDKQPKA